MEENKEFILSCLYERRDWEKKHRADLEATLTALRRWEVNTQQRINEWEAKP